MRHIWGVDIEIGQCMLDYISVKGDRDKAKANFDRALNGESFSEIEAYGDEKLQRLYYEDIYAPLYDDNDEVTGLSVLVIDVTNRRQKEENLFKSESRFRAIIEGTFEGISVARVSDMHVVYANPAVMDMFGYTQDEFLELTVDDLHPAEDLEFVKNEFRAQAAQKFITAKALPCITKEGEVFYCDVSSVPAILDGEECLVGYFTDVTESIKTQSIIKENETRIQNISNSVPGAVLRYKLSADNKDELLFLSQGAEALWETPHQEMLNDASKLWEKIYPEDVEGMQNSILKSAKTLELWNYEWRIQMDDGRLKWVNGRGFPVRQENGSTIWDSIITEITDQKETLLKLDDSQRLLDSINQNINEGIYRSDSRGVIYVNKAFLRMFRYSSMEEMKTLRPSDIYKDRSQRKQLIEQLDKNGFFENEEVQFVRKDGSEFIGLISSRAFKDFNGQVYWDGAIRDVTAERQSARRVLESQQLLESINKNINEAIYRSVNRKGLVYVNEEFVKIFGYDSAEELTSGNPVDLYKNPGDRQILGDELVEKGSYVNREVEFKRKDGSVFWGSISSIMIYGDDDEVYFDGAIRDITKQKEAELALKNQAEMQALLRQISSDYINVNLDQVEEIINKSLKDLARFSGADRAYIFDLFIEEKYCVNTHEWCDNGIDSFIDDLQYVPLEELPEVYETYKEGKVMNYPSVNELSNGSFKKIMAEQGVKSIVGVPIMQGSKCIGFTGFDAVRAEQTFGEMDVYILRIFADMLLNIRNRAQRQYELKQLLNTTTDQNKRLKEFSFMTSHNIRSSVSNLLGLSRLIQEDPGNLDYVELLNTTTEKLDTTIKNINQILHFENSFQVKEMVECNVKELIDRILKLNQKIIEDQGIHLNLDIPEDLTIHGIPAFLDSIFYNLLSNAFKYGITRNSKTIEVWSEEEEKEIRVYVKDMGWGIDLVKHKDKLFKLGSRLHISSDGQGLGLYMTKHQVEELGGKIEIESEVNVGTTFTLSFPKYPKNFLAALSDN